MLAKKARSRLAILVRSLIKHTKLYIVKKNWDELWRVKKRTLRVKPWLNPKTTGIFRLLIEITFDWCRRRRCWLRMSQWMRCRRPRWCGGLSRWWRRTAPFHRRIPAGRPGRKSRSTCWSQCSSQQGRAQLERGEIKDYVVKAESLVFSRILEKFSAV